MSLKWRDLEQTSEFTSPSFIRLNSKHLVRKYAFESKPTDLIKNLLKCMDFLRGHNF